MKGSLVLALSFALSASALVACAAPGDDDGDAPPAAASESAVNASTCALETADKMRAADVGLATAVMRCIVTRDIGSKGALATLASLYSAAELKQTPALERAAGLTAHERHKTVLALTAGTGGIVSAPGLQFQGGFFGEQGYSTLVQDGFLYERSPKWGGGTNQTGHFLTGTALTWDPSANAQNLAIQTRISIPRGESASKTALRLVVGHELVGDAGTQSGQPDAQPQYAAATDAALHHFLEALVADRAGKTADRDARLLDMMAASGYATADASKCLPSTCLLKCTTDSSGKQTCVKDAASCSCPWAQGNSLNDARLTLKSVRLGQRLAAGYNPSRGWLAAAAGIDYTSTLNKVTLTESPTNEAAFSSAADVGTWLTDNLGPAMR